MKKAFIFLLSIFFAIGLHGLAQAEVTGQCVNCHTMHNSQGGASMIIGYGAGAGPYGSLLRANGCLGCHATADGADIWQGVGDAPIVYNPSEPSYGANGLAAGDFYYVTLNNANGHNVAGITGVVFDGIPPGYGVGKADTDGNTPGGGLSSNWTDQQVTCAGYYGCHGKHDEGYDNMTGMKGAHHGDEGSGSYKDGTTLSKSYRFLNGITGVEDSDWECSTGNADHNWYQGATNFTTNSTISYLCAECHADYHGSAMEGADSHWKRHPSDGVLLSETQGYSSYDPTGTYDNNAPVAYTDPTTTSNATAVVMCLSCHRAHASPNNSVPMFRSSTALPVCNKCHNQ